MLIDFVVCAVSAYVAGFGTLSRPPVGDTDCMRSVLESPPLLSGSHEKSPSFALQPTLEALLG